MTILLQWLVEHAWVFYVACAIGVLIYAMRALAAHRERSLALFTLERETATSRVVQAWAMVFVFVVIGIVIFVGANYVLPSLSADGLGQPSPTATLSSGVQPPTPGLTATPSPTLDVLVPTVTSTPAPAPTVPLPLPTEPPTPEPTETPPGVVSGGVGVRFGDFLELANFGLPASEFTTAEPVPLTLYWRKLDGVNPVDYLVFTHLLAEDGHLIGQHDGPPAGGARPMTQWAAGEVVEDFHPMAFQDASYVGPARIAIGLYDPATGRVLTSTGSDHVILPVAITIVAQ
jgi:hypothetical protein